MDLIVDILSWILKGITLYTTIVGLCFLLPRQKYPKAAPHTRFAVLVAARNEENVIGELVGSLLRQYYPGDHYDITAPTIRRAPPAGQGQRSFPAWEKSMARGTC